MRHRHSRSEKWGNLLIGKTGNAATDTGNPETILGVSERAKAKKVST